MDFVCQPVPTYIESGYKESHSPRGRIAMMKAVVDGIVEPDEDFERSLDLCLGCRACEPVCPSGVNYGHLLEEARDIINQNKKHSLPYGQFEKLFLKGYSHTKIECVRWLACLGFISVLESKLLHKKWDI